MIPSVISRTYSLYIVLPKVTYPAVIYTRVVAVFTWPYIPHIAVMLS